MSAGPADRVRARAREIGFEEIGFSPAGPARRAEAFRRWLDRGFAGSMEYLAREPESRADVTRRSPWARTVVSAAVSYAQSDGPGDGAPFSRPAPSPAVVSPPDLARNGTHRRGTGIASLVSRYARGHDYHAVVRSMLEELAAFLREQSGGRAEVRTLVDTSAILERDHAETSGLAWTGKNTMSILREGGSYVFLGEILTDIEIESGSAIEERCGGCTRCMEACPTGAIVDAWLLDARRCISYLTIELRGSVPHDHRASIGGHLFGCDVCQEVCPWNARPSPARTDPQRPGPVLEDLTLADTVSLDEGAFRERFRPTALARTKRSGLVRNALIVAANLQDDEALAAGGAVLDDPDPVLRETAVWALAKGDARQRAAASRAAEAEPNADARGLMRESLARL